MDQGYLPAELFGQYVSAIQLLIGERRSCVFDQYSAGVSYGMGFISGGGFQGLGRRIIGLAWRHQPMR